MTALLALGQKLYTSAPSASPQNKNKSTTAQPPSSLSAPKEKHLDRFLRDAILAPLHHAPPSTYPRLATTLLSHLPLIVNAVGIDAVKHIQPLTSLLTGILSEPLGLAYPALLLEACRGLKTLMANAWPRVAGYRAVVVRGCCFAWVRCEEEGEDGVGHRGHEEDGEKRGMEGVQEVKSALREVLGMLDAVCAADEEVGKVWEGEKREVVAADGRLAGLFGVVE
jgi:hypothetical protein